jgi:hypothetical protein
MFRPLVLRRCPWASGRSITGGHAALDVLPVALRSMAVCVLHNHVCALTALQGGSEPPQPWPARMPAGASSWAPPPPGWTQAACTAAS